MPSLNAYLQFSALLQSFPRDNSFANLYGSLFQLFHTFSILKCTASVSVSFLLTVQTSKLILQHCVCNFLLDWCSFTQRTSKELFSTILCLCHVESDTSSCLFSVFRSHLTLQFKLQELEISLSFDLCRLQ